MAIEYEDDGKVLIIGDGDGWDFTAYSDLSVIVDRYGAHANFEFSIEEWEELVGFMQAKLEDAKREQLGGSKYGED